MKSWACFCWMILSTTVLAAEFYVDGRRPDDSAEGTTWATAKKTIQGAVNAAADGDRIIVTDGVYTASAYLGNVVTIDKLLDIQSVSGASKTIIDGGQNNRCVCVGPAYTNTTLQGFTLQNGYVTNHAGGSLRGTYVDCIFRGHRLLQTSPAIPTLGAGAVSACLINCVLTDNQSEEGAAAAFCTLDRCRITSNTCRSGEPC